MSLLQKGFLGKITLIFIVFGSVAGCGITRNLMRPVDLVERSEQKVPNPVDAPLDLDTFKFLKSDTMTAYATASTNKDERNRLQDILLQRSDVSCSQFKDDMFARVAARKVTLKSIALFSGSAAAIVSGETAKSILAGVGASAVGYDAIVDSEILQNQFITIIISEIDSGRTTIKGNIESSQKLTIEEYSVDRAVRDAVKYSDTCSFLNAIVHLAEKAKTPQMTQETILAQKKTLEDELKNVEAKLGGATTETKAGYLKRINDINNRLNVLTELSPLIR